jgi:hypothetical protein
MEKNTSSPEPIKIMYNSSLDGLSKNNLKQEIRDLYNETIRNPDPDKRSEKTFWRTISQWEESGKCTIEDICITLGWYFHFCKDKDPSWKKIDEVFSENQKEGILFPIWVKKGDLSAPTKHTKKQPPFPHWSKDKYSRY